MPTHLPSGSSGRISLCVMLWANPGLESDLSYYLDDVLDRVAEHGGIVLQRGVTDGSDDQPREVHFFEFTSQDSLDNFMGDERRVQTAPERRRVLARIEIMRVTLKPVPEPLLASGQLTT